MEIIKLILILLISFVISFGLWYLIGWFLSNQSNLFLWPWYGKIAFLIFGTSSFSGVMDELLKM